MDARQKTEANQPPAHGFRLEALDPKVMNVLVLMTSHARQFVSRDELLARLWPSAVVTDDAVTRCFYVLRKQLSQAGGDRRYRTLIETLPKRGYRLNGEIAPLRPQPVAPSRQTGSHRSLAIAAAFSAAIALYVIVALG